MAMKRVLPGHRMGLFGKAIEAAAHIDRLAASQMRADG